MVGNKLLLPLGGALASTGQPFVAIFYAAENVCLNPVSNVVRMLQARFFNQYSSPSPPPLPL